MPKILQFYILCRDRPAFAMECIKSVIADNSDSVEVIVSDNSITDQVLLMVQSNFPSVSYIRRVPPLGSEDHFKAILSESTTKYTIMFHDDDCIRRGFTSEMLQIIEAHPEVSAVACAGEIINENGSLTGKRLYNSNEALRYIENSNALLGYYLTVIDGKTPPPFPSYIYRSNFLNSQLFSSKDGGKHADLSFLLKLLHSGPILWSNKPLMEYRLHSTNDSVTEFIPDRLSLLNYAYLHEGLKRNSQMVLEYKFFYWGRWTASNATKELLDQGKLKWRFKIVRKFLILFTIKNLFLKPVVFKKIIKRLLKA